MNPRLRAARALTEEHGVCVTHDEPTIWFPRDRKEAARAQANCLKCPVRTECLTLGKAYQAWGMWGGILLADGEPRRTYFKGIDHDIDHDVDHDVADPETANEPEMSPAVVPAATVNEPAPTDAPAPVVVAQTRAAVVRVAAGGHEEAESALDELANATGPVLVTMPDLASFVGAYGGPRRGSRKTSESSRVEGPAKAS